MKLKLSVNPITEADYAQILANLSQIVQAIFDIKYNIADDYEMRINAEEFDDQYALLENILFDINELFININLKKYQHEE